MSPSIRKLDFGKTKPHTRNKIIKKLAAEANNMIRVIIAIGVCIFSCILDLTCTLK